MPAQRVDYVTKPFVGQPYQDSGYGRTLAQLMLQRGNDQAALHLQRGENAARMWQGAGNAINNAVSGWQQSVEQNRQRELEAAREARSAEAQGLQIEGAKMNLAEAKRGQAGRELTRQILPLARRQDGLATYDRDVIAREFDAAGMSDMLPEVLAKLDEQDTAHAKVLEARRDAVAGDAFRVLQSGATDETFASILDYWKENDALPARELKEIERLGKDPETRQQALMAAVQSSPKFTAMLGEMRKAQEPKLSTVAPGASVYDERNPQAGPLFTAPAVPEKAPANIEAAILAETDPAKRAELVLLKEQLVRAGRAPAAPPPQEPLTAIVGEDGQPVLVPRSQAVGKKPASTREVGRQVTSGDAGDIAEFNTALDDITTMREALKGNKATGAAAQIGAAVPNAITEFTGWGSDAKQKQAVIDRVRQVIGKALEAGVLRKEDEAKYAKILPTIGDTPQNVAAKLDGLEKAIQQRQQRKIDALDSAGYDTSKFKAPSGAKTIGRFKVEQEQD